MAHSSSDGATALRAQVKRLFFDQLVWCPWGDQHKMWTTSITPTYNVNLPEKPQTGHGSPQICINPAK